MDWNKFIEEQRAYYKQCKGQKWFNAEDFAKRMKTLIEFKEELLTDGTLPPSGTWYYDMIRAHYLDDLPRMPQEKVTKKK